MSCIMTSRNAANNNMSEVVPHINLLGVKIHCVDMDTVLDLVRSYIRQGSPHIIVTADSTSVVLAQEDAEFKEIVNSADIVTPDSSGILFAAKKMKTPLKGRVSGVDIAYNICGLAAKEDFSIFLLGAKPGVAEDAAEKT